MKTYGAAIFDLDGTLLNTIDDLADSVNHALRQTGQPERSVAEVASFVGNGVETLMRRAVPPGTPEPDFLAAYRMFREHYPKNMETKTRPYPGILPMLRALKASGTGVAIASNKFHDGVEALAGKYFPGLYAAAEGEREGGPQKPDPAIVRAVLARLGAKDADTLYIGDSDVDADTARNAGLDFLGVGWGLRPKRLLLRLGAIAVADDPSEILPYFGLPRG